MAADIDRYVSPKFAAAKLGISLATLWRWAKHRPDFPKPISLSPGCTRFSEAKLEAFVRAREVSQ